MTVQSQAERVFDHIDVDELVKVALDPGNIDSPTGDGPGVRVGGGNFGMKISDLVLGAKLYALTALELCNQERSSERGVAPLPTR